MDEKLLNRIIAVAYDDSTLWEKYKINKLAQQDHKVRSVLEEYKNVAIKTHSLELEDCPEKIISCAKKFTKTKTNNNTLFFDLYSFLFRRPAVSFGILSVFILAIVSTLIFKRPEIQQQYSNQEIQIADDQVKQTLAMIYGVFQKTATTVEREVLNNHVRKPISESFNLVNDYLEGENKNEKIN